ncbi:MAG: DUF134 domain-containing protein [Spirochaetaceae bacterium]|jgi:predicted DNA-binding protein (UPF0251 family)|nr:DUF134 domain-containing protein [Spirochaetaceae bacterium]
MARPSNPRTVCRIPQYKLFKPAGKGCSARESVELGLDEFEALRLSDLEGLYQEDGALRLGVSRQTFARILGEAHRKVITAMVEGRFLVIEGGNIQLCQRCIQEGLDGWDNKKCCWEN